MTPDNTVVFDCTGNAPLGIDITYGPDGSNFGASKLPFHKSLRLNPNALYYTITAQLQGSGAVHCSTTVHSEGIKTTKAGAASGGYNIAMAEVCGDFMGGREGC